MSTRTIILRALTVLVLCSLAAYSEDNCVGCHADPDFRVTNKKLFDYYQDWSNSTHRLAGVSCVDCHGGNPDKESKELAHGSNGMRTAVEFHQISSTCGECHAEVYTQFEKSLHFKAISSEVGGLHGPTCVTCHGSPNTGAITVGQVAEVCRRCHNKTMIGHGEVARQAEDLLGDFTSIHRFRRYIIAKGEQEQVLSMLQKMEKRINALEEAWHRFDLAVIQQETTEILDELKLQKTRIIERNRHQPPIHE